MKLIIDMPEKYYDFIKNNEYKFSGSRIYDCVLNGTVLPKEYGRLFILDEELAKKFFTSFSFSCQKWISEVGISNATLKVIEADKEKENENNHSET